MSQLRAICKNATGNNLFMLLKRNMFPIVDLNRVVMYDMC